MHEIWNSLGAAGVAHIVGLSLETSEGDFAAALGLGLVLIGISIAVSATAFTLIES